MRSRFLSLSALAVLPVAMAASPAGAQLWWWPPQMEVQPVMPDPASQVVITLWGDWPDLCPPVGGDFTIDGHTINVRLWSFYSNECWMTVITPYSLPMQVGQLPAGMYSVYAQHLMGAGPTTEWLLVGTIDVLDPLECYADCDASGTLNIDDFICFINEFSQAQLLPPAQQVEHYANCDGSTTQPVLTVDDFICFINEFAAGCP